MIAILQDRFWSKVDKTDSCWNWRGYKNSHGYGKFGVNSTIKYAHRLSYEYLRHEIPKDLFIDHLCRNPTCVNPDHLEVVTKRENTARGISESAINQRKIHCIRGHEFTEQNTRFSKGEYRYFRRRCKSCTKTYMHSYKQQRKFFKHFAKYVNSLDDDRYANDTISDRSRNG